MGIKRVVAGRSVLGLRKSGFGYIFAPLVGRVHTDLDIWTHNGTRGRWGWNVVACEVRLSVGWLYEVREFVGMFGDGLQPGVGVFVGYSPNGCFVVRVRLGGFTGCLAARSGYFLIVSDVVLA